MQGRGEDMRWRTWRREDGRRSSAHLLGRRRRGERLELKEEVGSSKFRQPTNIYALLPKKLANKSRSYK